MTRGGSDEKAIRFESRAPEPVRQVAQAVGYDSPRRADDRVLPGVVGGARGAVPGLDQSLPAGLRRDGPPAGDAVASRAQERRGLTIAEADEAPSLMLTTLALSGRRCSFAPGV